MTCPSYYIVIALNGVLMFLRRDVVVLSGGNVSSLDINFGMCLCRLFFLHINVPVVWVRVSSICDLCAILDAITSNQIILALLFIRAKPGA